MPSTTDRIATLPEPGPPTLHTPRSGCPTPASLVDGGRGLIILEDDDRALGRRLRRHGIAGTPAQREALRDVVVGAVGLSTYVAALQMPRKLVRAIVESGTGRDLLIGARVDAGAQPLPGRTGETITCAPRNVAEDLAALAASGASFAAWRSVFVIRRDAARPETPSLPVVQTNTRLMSRFAAASLTAGLVPVLTVDVSRDGGHGPDEWSAVTSWILEELFEALQDAHVPASRVVLSTGMAIEGRGGRSQCAPEAVASATAATCAPVPAHLGALSVLAEGERFPRAVANLSAVRSVLPGRPVGFTVHRGVTEAVMAAWRGESSRVGGAREMLLDRLRRLRDAAAGTERDALPEATRAAATSEPGRA
jgi:fructose-bisphosphate aldolase, class I